jgi:hypothetical protein
VLPSGRLLLAGMKPAGAGTVTVPLVVTVFVSKTVVEVVVVGASEVVETVTVSVVVKTSYGIFK